MPKKIRELKQMLRKAGFSLEPAKGSHTKWSHPLLTGKVTLSGNDGDDAKTYQEKDVANAIQDVQNRQSEGQ
ncbi:MAG: type II toxin-antitoxin system HicA family toxin [Synechococcaceae cyanobacterium RM1_1_27]|nr:type II toxin-antitoxin system HicA family toxin [Synechococcaceae cyanobacterium SM2_3_2]NJO85750.1 type II toxin-antitoxin system HicA family toxin [Synechococcaceae cyanobacterium RM1_1_27]